MLRANFPRLDSDRPRSNITLFHPPSTSGNTRDVHETATLLAEMVFIRIPISPCLFRRFLLGISDNNKTKGEKSPFAIFRVLIEVHRLAHGGFHQGLVADWMTIAWQSIRSRTANKYEHTLAGEYIDSVPPLYPFFFSTAPSRFCPSLLSKVRADTNLLSPRVMRPPATRLLA